MCFHRLKCGQNSRGCPATRLCLAVMPGEAQPWGARLNRHIAWLKWDAPPVAGGTAAQGCGGMSPEGRSPCKVSCPAPCHLREPALEPKPFFFSHLQPKALSLAQTITPFRFDARNCAFARPRFLSVVGGMLSIT